jgi:hypothetical protein
MAANEAPGCQVVMALILFGMGAMVGCIDGRSRGIEQEQAKAIEAEVGRWEIDPTSGQKHFRYGPSKP